uniref:Uncharacterized protein n=1 Tax=Setaria digitata TaxID=48799 RepID=A0A915Q6L0_9BILA
MWDPVNVCNPFGFGGLQLPRADPGSCRVRKRPYIDRSQSNIYPSSQYILTVAVRANSAQKPNRRRFKRRNLTVVD